MRKIIWDATGERLYETGVDHGVLYESVNGQYVNGVAWNGLTGVTEAPSGAEPSPFYADNMKYLNLISIEEFGGTIEAVTFPKEFTKFDGGVAIARGVVIGQQARGKFGFAYRTLIGNDEVADRLGYKLHLVYGAQAAPSERAYTTVNDTPEPNTFSWEFSTTPVAVTGQKPTAILTIDSTEVDPDNLAALEAVLYGTEGVDPRMPLPDEVLSFFTGSATAVRPAAPSWDSASRTITIPTTANVIYMVNGEPVSGTIVLDEDEEELVTARPAPGFYFSEGSDDDWAFGA